jgi:uncharacterized protein YceH (UPF0502 family)
VADLDLTVSQARVLGSLLEKELTTPNSYPTTLNALVSACNQTSNRDPVIHLDPQQVETAALALKSKGLLRVVHPGAGERSTRYRQVADELLGLDEAERAVLCVLLLRGPQTVAELRSRTDRLHRFAASSGVDDVLHGLAGRDEPLAERLERFPGQKEARWTQLLETASARQLAAPTVISSSPQFGGTTTSHAGHAPAVGGADVHQGRTEVPALPDLVRRVGALESRLDALIEALGDLVTINPETPEED